MTRFSTSGLSLDEAGEAVAEQSVDVGPTAPMNPAFVTELAEQEIWDFKRARQKRDLENVRAGRLSAQSLSWFTPERAKATKLVDSPY